MQEKLKIKFWRECFEKLYIFFVDFLFPLECLACGREGEWWCSQCQNNFDFSGVWACPVCGAVVSGICSSCAPASSLDGVIALFEYKTTGPIADLIKVFKYHHALEMVILWQRLVHNFFVVHSQKVRQIVTGDAWGIVAVPLHIRRQRERGFNQAAEVAEMVYHELKESVADIFLVPKNFFGRTRYTIQQALLKGVMRRTNVENAFTWMGKEPPPRQILLVDDVFTTGSTLEECARTLKANGVERVWGVVLARVKPVV